MRELEKMLASSRLLGGHALGSVQYSVVEETAQYPLQVVLFLGVPRRHFDSEGIQALSFLPPATLFRLSLLDTAGRRHRMHSPALWNVRQQSLLYRRAPELYLAP